MTLSFDEFFANIDSMPIVLVDFFHPQCGPCRQVPAVLKQFQQRVDVPIWKVNVHTDLSAARDLSISTVPTIVLYVGGEEVSRQVGVPTAQKLIDMVRPYM